MFYLRDQNGNELNWFDDLSKSITSASSGFMKADIEEDEKEYKVTMDVPGVNKDNLEISYNKDTLVVSYKKDETKEEKKKNYVKHERFTSSYKRSFYLENGDASNIHAHLENGVLSINVAKKTKEIDNKNVITIE
ncbi:MAG: Hsp20 family protein [Acholeplasmatales bacterium]|nr:Hsp20 family protein [Acholeplasmatales bacterium]